MGILSATWWDKVWSDPNVVFAGAVAAFTLALVIVTVALVIVGAVQAHRLRQTVDETRKAAKAAERAAVVAERALVDLEGPILQVVDPFPSIDNPLSDEDCGMSAHYSIENFGRTPATLHEVSLQFWSLTEPLNRPVYSTIIPMMTVIPQGRRIKMDSHPIHMQGMLAFGYLDYTDIFGSQHRTGFGLTRKDRVWVVVGGATYNYHRIERRL